MRNNRHGQTAIGIVLHLVQIIWVNINDTTTNGENSVKATTTTTTKRKKEINKQQQSANTSSRVCIWYLHFLNSASIQMRRIASKTKTKEQRGILLRKTNTRTHVGSLMVIEYAPNVHTTTTNVCLHIFGVILYCRWFSSLFFFSYASFRVKWPKKQWRGRKRETKKKPTKN